MDNYLIKDILLGGYLNLDFIIKYATELNNERGKNISINEFYNEFIRTYNAEGKYSLFNPASVLAFMYLTLVLPEQSFYNNIRNDTIKEDEWGIKIEIDQKLELGHIIRRLRNALSHNHVIVFKNMEFIFWDARPPKKDIAEAEVKYIFTFEGLKKFLNKWEEEIVRILKSGSI